jgi:hypothetical protein
MGFNHLRIRPVLVEPGGTQILPPSGRLKERIRRWKSNWKPPSRSDWCYLLGHLVSCLCHFGVMFGFSTMLEVAEFGATSTNSAMSAYTISIYIHLFHSLSIYLPYIHIVSWENGDFHSHRMYQHVSCPSFLVQNIDPRSMWKWATIAWDLGTSPQWWPS